MFNKLFHKSSSNDAQFQLLIDKICTRNERREAQYTFLYIQKMWQLTDNQFDAIRSSLYEGNNSNNKNVFVHYLTYDHDTNEIHAAVEYASSEKINMFHFIKLTPEIVNTIYNNIR